MQLCGTGTAPAGEPLWWVHVQRLLSACLIHPPLNPTHVFLGSEAEVGVDMVQALIIPVFISGNPDVSFNDFSTLEGVRKAISHKDVVLGAW